MTAETPTHADLAWLATDVVARQAQIRPQQMAVSELASGRTLTYAELELEIRRTEAWLRRTVAPGARVALLARNSLHHLRLFYGCARAGAVYVPLNWRLTGAELAVLLADAAPEVLAYEAEFAAEAQAALAEAGLAPAVLRIASEADELAEAIAPCAPVEPGRIAPLEPSMLLYTSGTTGRPKGVVITPKTAFYAAMNFTYAHDFSAQHAQLCDVPLFHVVGALAVVHGTLLAGGRFYLSDRFEPGRTLAVLGDRARGVSHYFCVPQMARTLADHPTFGSADLAGLGLITGGAPMPAELTLRLAEAGLRPANGYGMSEIGTALGMPFDAAAAQAKAGSAGLPAPAVELRLVGPDGSDAPLGEIGEIWLRGPAVTPGYWNQPEATANAFVDGWLRTGDAARRDADGFYFVVDRWKDMYITGGENVYPAEIEATLLAMTGVAEAAVVGVPDARWGESGCAFLVRSDADCTAEAVLAWCEARLARYKRPAHVRFVEALPRTASGKLQKPVLRQWFAGD